MGCGCGVWGVACGVWRVVVGLATSSRCEQGMATNETRTALNVPDAGVHDWGVGADKLKALCRSRVRSPAAVAASACAGTVVRPTLFATDGLCVTAGAYDGCPTVATAMEAVAMCQQKAARLCTRSELELGLAGSVSCTDQNVWSSSTCVNPTETYPDDHDMQLPRLLVSWSNDGRNTSTCSHLSDQRETGSVLCCADLPADAVHDAAVWRSRSEPAQYDESDPLMDPSAAWLTPRIKPSGQGNSASSGTAR